MATRTAARSMSPAPLKHLFIQLWCGRVNGQLSFDDQCLEQAIDAATFATWQGTTVYTIAYGAVSCGCLTDITGPWAREVAFHRAPCYKTWPARLEISNPMLLPRRTRSNPNLTLNFNPSPTALPYRAWYRTLTTTKQAEPRSISLCRTRLHRNQ